MEKALLEVKKSFESSPFFSLVGFQILHFEEGNVKIKLPVSERLLNANRTLHGGVHATMLDVIMGMTIRSITKTRCSTINLNVSYLEAIDEGEIFATGKIIKQGYRIVQAEGQLESIDGNLLAKGIGSFRLIRS